MTYILAIDPGTEQSAAVLYDQDSVIGSWMLQNVHMRDVVTMNNNQHVTLVIENVESYGKPVGRETFQTVMWIGRFIELWHPREVVLVPRRSVKLHLCDTVRGVTDANISAALYDKFGGSRQAAVGTKKQPGPLYGLGAHERAALAVAVTFCESEEFVQSIPAAHDNQSSTRRGPRGSA